MNFAILLAAAAAPLATPDCPIDRVVYRLQGAPDYTAGFARQIVPTSYASDLVLWMKTPKRTYWFSFGSPNGYGGTYIGPDVDPQTAFRRHQVEQAEDSEPGYVPREQTASTEEETISIPFDAFRPDLTTWESPPQKDDPAPARLFARGLGPALWYNAVGLSGGDAAAEQEAIPIAMFEPAGCDAAAH